MSCYSTVWTRFVVILIGLLVMASCGSRSMVASGPLLGEVFPTVTGTSLAGEEVILPEDYEGGPSIYLIGYVQQTQFDIDRWTIGLLQVGPQAKIVEIPTIPGLVPTLISGWIDDGMRSGIPEEDWPAVVTVYGSDAGLVANMTGTLKPNNARVLLVDGDGVIRWFWDQGFSAARLLDLMTTLKKMQLRQVAPCGDM